MKRLYYVVFAILSPLLSPNKWPLSYNSIVMILLLFISLLLVFADTRHP